MLRIAQDGLQFARTEHAARSTQKRWWEYPSMLVEGGGKAKGGSEGKGGEERRS